MANSWEKDFFEESKENNSLEIKENLELILRNWYWLALSVLLALFAAYFYLKYQEDIYEAKASVLIEDQGGLTIEEFSGLEEIFGTGTQVMDETYVLKSIPLVKNVVNNLNMDVRQSRKTQLSKKFVEYYKDSPLSILKYSEGENFTEPIGFQVTILDPSTFQLAMEDDDFEKTFRFGDLLNIKDKVKIKINKSENFTPNSDPKVFISLIPREQRTLGIIEELEVVPAEKMSNVLNINYQDNRLEKAKDVLDELITQYSYNSVVDKKQIAENTSKFIDERIDLLTTELAGVEKNIEDFKQGNNLTDIVTEAKLYSDNSSQINNELVQTEMKYKILDYLSQHMNQNENSLLPTNIGLEDSNISYQIDKYNQMILQRNRYDQSTTESNPEYKILQQNIDNMRRSIAQEVSNQKNGLRITISGLNTQSNLLNNKLKNIPQQERQYREIFRQQQTKEALFLYLLQKKEEVAISEISITPDFKTINNAFGSYIPVSPNRKLIYLIAFFLGLIIPVGLIFVRNLLDTKIHTTQDLENLTNIPIAGNISKYTQTKDGLVLDKTNRTSTAESMRLLVTNLEFMFEQDKSNKTVLVTSTLSGEGKTFVSVNLGANLAYNGYKVVILGMDIRAPKIQDYFEIKNPKGVTHFVRNENLSIEDITNHYIEYPNLDVITSGTILPNFLDILTNKRIDELFFKLKEKYDYIIIDSAPVGLVSDTFNIAKFIDLCLYVVRANYLDKRMINVVERIHKDKKFPKTYIVLNDLDVTSKKYGSSYGYGYGYGYGTEDENKKYALWTKKYWKKLLRK